jgi:hypothetical protein
MHARASSTSIAAGTGRNGMTLTLSSPRKSHSRTARQHDLRALLCNGRGRWVSVDWVSDGSWDGSPPSLRALRLDACEYRSHDVHFGCYLSPGQSPIVA